MILRCGILRQFFDFGYEVEFVEGGTFTMGCTSEQGTDCYVWEKPSHSVTLSSCSIGKYEVSIAQWVSVMGLYPSSFTNPACNDCPVEQVSWNDIQIFLTTLNNKTGKNYRLPTEAEWEYAARGGKNSLGYKYSGSNTQEDAGWYWYISGNKSHIVGGKTPNELGIYDMSGNVWEWCGDWYASYTSSSQTDPTGPVTGTQRVYRGGGWTSNYINLRVTARTKDNPTYTLASIGFRLVLP